MVRAIPFYQAIDMNVDSVRDRVAEILASGQLSNGKYCRKLEAKLKDMYESKFALLTPSGTKALFIAVMCRFQSGSADLKTVATQAFTDKSHTGLPYTLPIPIDPRTWNAPSEGPYGSKVLTVFTDAFGNISNPPVNLNNTVWDMAHCIGLNAHQGAFARILSFAPSKIISMGEGGVILTDNKDLKDMVTGHRNLFRPTEFGAILALYQLSNLTKILRRRREIAENYIDALGDKLQFQEIPIKTNWSRVGCLAKTASERERIANALKGAVELRQYYEPIYPDAVAQDVYDRMLVLPSYHVVDEHEVIKRLRKVL